MELVITAPQDEQAQVAYEVGARTTLGVLTTLIAQSVEKLTIISPFLTPQEAFDTEPLLTAMLSAINKGVKIEIASTGRGIDDVLKSKTVKEASPKIRFFQSAANYMDERILGSHAKIYLADESNAYIGSANLTKPGLSQHFEMGVLVRGKIAHQVSQTWRYLKSKGYFIEVKF